MNVLQAIKSGKRFRRKPSIPGTVSWIGPLDVSTHWGASFRLDDILAEDWEVEEVSTTITGNQFDAAWDKAAVAAWAKTMQPEEEYYTGHYIDALYTSLKKELGL